MDQAEMDAQALADLASDGIHPNQAGHDYLGRRLADAIAKEVATWPAPTWRERLASLLRRVAERIEESAS